MKIKFNEEIRRGLASTTLISSYFLASCAVGAQYNLRSSVSSNEPAQKQSTQGKNQNSIQKKESITLDKIIQQIRNFTQNSEPPITDPDTGDSYPVTARITSAFEQSPPKGLILPNGLKIFWGWQEGQPERKSFAIFDEKNIIRMVGAFDNSPILYSHLNHIAITNMEEYRKLIEDRSTYMAAPVMQIYAENQQAVDKFYPLVNRWMQAAMVGFNANCGSEAQSPTCHLASEVQIATTLYRNTCKTINNRRNACKLQLPTVGKHEVEIDSFKQ